MQATVAGFVAETGCGTVLRDDGSELSFDGNAFRASGLRRLRPGQRVRIAVGDGRVTALTIATFALPVDVTDHEEQ
jgi:cold shock CspA family protein